MKKPITAQVFTFLLALILCLAGCSSTPTDTTETTPPPDTSVSTETSTPELSEETEQTTVSIPETTAPEKIEQPEPDDEDFVRVIDYIPDIVVDLRYSTENNFTGRQIYEFSDLWLRYGTVKKLMLVQDELRQSGLYLKVWDGFRPVSAQFKLWEICPDPVYVANPNNGFSSHSRGNTIDVTLVYEDGTEVRMPTGFDDFSTLADRDYSDCEEETAANALMLEQLMAEYGFKPYSGEWWHFSDTQSYPVEENFQPTESALYYADCDEFITLRTGPSTTEAPITWIPANAEFETYARSGDFLLVRYQDLWGYVMASYASPIGT